jgi:hypothetical protein
MTVIGHRAKRTGQAGLTGKDDRYEVTLSITTSCCVRSSTNDGTNDMNYDMNHMNYRV